MLEKVVLSTLTLQPGSKEAETDELHFTLVTLRYRRRISLSLSLSLLVYRVYILVSR